MTNYSPSNPKKLKSDRKKALLDIVRSESPGTQSELVEALRKKGFECTQVSVSRDIRELGLVKKGGRYAAPEGAFVPEGSAVDLAVLSANVRGFVKGIVAAGDNIVVVRTMPGTAHSVGLLVDNLGWPEIAGTVAGDDTLLAAVTGGKTKIKEVLSKLSVLIRKG